MAPGKCLLIVQVDYTFLSILMHSLNPAAVHAVTPVMLAVFVFDGCRVSSQLLAAAAVLQDSWQSAACCTSGHLLQPLTDA
jgi:hypothetical protein